MTSADASTNPFTDCSAHFTSHASSHHSTDAPAHAFGFTAQRKLEESEESFVGEEDLSDPSRFARAAPNCNCDNEEDSQEISKSSPSFTKPTYVLNREGIEKVREIEHGISELSVDELSSLVTNSVTKAFGELDELYVELEELRQKCPFPECIDLDKLIADQKQCILCVEPDGRIWCIWILLCNTPDVLGGVNATGGGSYLPGYKRKYTTCDSIVALRNINSSLILTGGVQPMDTTALNPIEAHNSRTQCTITPEQLRVWRDAEQRWTCPYTRQLEARIQAKLILVQMKHCQRLGVLTALLDAGGITKLSHRVIEEILKLAPDLAGIVISKLGHIQGFKDGRWNAEEKVDGISKVFAEAYDSLGIVHDETLEEIFFRDYGFSPRKRGWDVGSKHTEASRALMSKPKAKMKGNKNAAGARTEETKAKMKGNKNAAGARTEAAKTLISKSQEGLSYVRKDGTHVNKWKVKEHKRFIKGLKKFGWSDWVGVASVVGTRSNDQCKNHAGRMRREEKKRLMLLYKRK